MRSCTSVLHICTFFFAFVRSYFCAMAIEESISFWICTFLFLRWGYWRINTFLNLYVLFLRYGYSQINIFLNLYVLDFALWLLTNQYLFEFVRCFCAMAIDKSISFWICTFLFLCYSYWRTDTFLNLYVLVFALGLLASQYLFEFMRSCFCARAIDKPISFWICTFIEESTSLRLLHVFITNEVYEKCNWKFTKNKFCWLFKIRNCEYKICDRYPKTRYFHKMSFRFINKLIPEQP